MAVGVLGAAGRASAQQDPVSQFLLQASSAITQNDVVKNACRTAARIQQYATLASSLGNALQRASGWQTSFSSQGLVTADLASAVSGQAFAHAAGMGSDAERYGAAFGLASLCNTSEMARIAFSQFDFLRNVVNALIGRDLPLTQSLFATLGQIATPISPAIRIARYNRLFGNGDGTGAPPPPGQLALLDSASAYAYQAASRADTVVQRTAQQLATIYGEMYAAPTPDGRCFNVDDAGDTVWSAANRVNPITGDPNTCGPVSPGRARQLMPAIGGVAVAVHAGELQLMRATMDVETAQVARAVELEQLRDVGAPNRVQW